MMHGDFLRRPLLHGLLIALLGLLVYSNTFHSSFHFDDIRLIIENPLVKDIGYFVEPSKADSLKYLENTDTLRYFKTRYVGFLSLWGNYRLHGLEVAGYHAVNLALHIINAALVYLLVTLTFRTRLPAGSLPGGWSNSVALFSGLLFVAHPLQTEAVTYVLSRFVLLATMFYLLSVVLYVEWRLGARTPAMGVRRRRGHIYLLSLLSCVLAMKTKENAFTLPIMIALYEFLFFRDGIRKRAVYLVPFLLTMLIIPLTYLGLNMGAGDIESALEGATRLGGAPSRLDYILTQSRVVAGYIGLLLFPTGQNVDHDRQVYHSFLEPQVFMSFLFLLSVLGSGVYMLYRSRITDHGHSSRITHHASRLCAFGIFWFFLALSVESSVLPIGEMMVEYRLYLPSAGVHIALASGAVLLINSVGNRVPAYAAMVLVLLVLSSATYARNTVWEDEFALWRDAAEKSPNKSRPRNNLGIAYMAVGMTEEAIEQYRMALSVDPDLALAYNNLGGAYLAKGMTEEAIENFKAALKLDPGYADAYNNLGVAYEEEGMTEDAIKHYKAAIESDPGLAEAYVNLGAAYMEEGFIEKAEEQFRMALKLKPDDAALHSDIGSAYLKREDADKAVEHFEAALRLNPDDAMAHNNLGAAYEAMGQVERAIEQYRLAAKLEPRSPVSYYNLGGAYYSKGLFDNAIELYLIALKLNPDYPEAHGNLGLAYQSKGMADKAIEHYRTALELVPDYAQAHFNLGLVFFQKGLTDKAREEFEAALQIDPGYQRARQFLSKLDQKR